MEPRLLKLFVAALFISTSFCDESVADKDDDGVYIVTDANIDAFLEANPNALIEFYAPWCGHCKTLAPEYGAAARTLNQHKQPVALAKCDATAEAGVAKKYKIEGFPTLKWWMNKEGPNEYDGPRDHAGIVTWIRSRIDPSYKPPPSAVPALTKDTFDTFVADKDLVLVEFYAPWCGHCKKLEPEFERAARALKHRDPPVYLAKVDATEQKELGQEYGVSGYPTLKILRKGKKFDYDGPREADGIINYMVEQSRPAASEVSTVKETKRVMSKDDVTIVGFFAAKDTRLFRSFMDAADSLRGSFNFAYSLSPEVLKGMKAQPNTIRLYFPERWQSKYEKAYREFNNFDASREDVMAFAEKESTPLVGHRHKKNMKRYEGKIPLIVAYFAVDFSHEHIKGTQFWRERVLSVAGKYVDGPYTFAVSNEEEFADELANAGLAESGMEVNVIAYGADGKRYPWDPEQMDEDEFTVETFNTYMEKLKTNRVKAYVKSQPVPTDTKSPVKQVVASNFDKIVRDESKDVLIEFYAPWCGHCKKLEPVYTELAKKVAGDKNLVIAKMDATANDAQDNFSADGFPTIYFAPKGRKKDPIKFESGERTAVKMLEFMKEHAVASFKDAAKKTEL